MAGKWSTWTAALAVLPFLVVTLSVQAQGNGLLVAIQGSPDAESSPPGIHIHVSVIDSETAHAIDGLTPADFALYEADEKTRALDVSYEPIGLAIAIVVDRGRISAPDDSRISEVTDLVRELIARLNITGNVSDDVLAVVGIGKGGTPKPVKDFTWSPVDVNPAIDTLVAMEGKEIPDPTPPYDGLDRALRLLTENRDETIDDLLSHRRKVIVLFSDGFASGHRDRTREKDLIRRADAHGISLYTVGMAPKGGHLDTDEESALQHLASETQGLYQVHSDNETYQHVLDLFDGLVTQRHQYVLDYDTQQPKGDCPLRIQVDTPLGSTEVSTILSSILETPQIEIVDPGDGSRISVPYSDTLERFTETTVTLRVRVTPRDGAPRLPAQVRYIANGVHIGTGTAPPDYPFEWDVTGIVTPTKEMQSRDYDLVARAQDAYLQDSSMDSDSLDIDVRWEGTSSSPLEASLDLVIEYWWLGMVVLGLLVVPVYLLSRSRPGRAGTSLQPTTQIGGTRTGTSEPTVLLRDPRDQMIEPTIRLPGAQQGAGRTALDRQGEDAAHLDESERQDPTIKMNL